jgi:serine/threonine protein kinase/tetratricopeptide (TPR) repeat protein
MLDERQKKLAAAILAVREGRVTATEAAALVKDPKSSATDFFKIGGNGDAHRLPDPQLIEAALAGAGMSDEETKLFSVADPDKADQIARKTLFNVAPTMPPENNSTERPSTTRLRRPSRITERERYSIKREYARGGQGRIMIARDNVVGREVALKELLPELQEQQGGTPATAGVETIGVVERFLREAKVTGQLEHPNVVPVYEIGKQESGSLYYTMKFVRGQTMAERLRDIDRLQLPREKKLALRLKLLEPFQGICNAVAFAHSRGVIHRDLKPQNIMVGDFGETVLLDWGLARVKGQDDKIGKQLTLLATNMISESLMRQSSDGGLTVDGTVFGTPHYMPPEQARADLREIDEQSDVYSLGAILYEILTGAPPYDGPTAGFILQQVMSGPPRKIKEREPHAPPDLMALCEFAMAHDKGRRMKTALQLASEIQAYRDGGQLKVYTYGAFEQARRAIARHRGAVIAALLTLLLLLGGGTSFFVIVISEKAEAESSQAAAEADRDQTNASLLKAQQARDAQQRLERQQAIERDQKRKARESEIRSLQDAIARMRVEPLLRDVAARVTQYEDIEDRGRVIEMLPAERSSNANLLMSVLGFFAAQETLISLQASGDDALEAQLAAEIARQKKTLSSARLLAARLATYNSEFAQAELLMAGTEAAPAELEAARKAMTRTRDAMLSVQRKNIADALADIAQGLMREGRKGPSLFEYIEKLKGYHERQTVELLTAALAPLATRAKAKSTDWPRADLDVGILSCRVLGKLELPLETVPPLLDFLQAFPPVPLRLECALALCDTRSPACALPLARFARAKGADLWPRIEPAFAVVPMPEQMRRESDMDTVLCRAVFLLAHADFKAAIEACNDVVGRDADNAEARILRGRAYARSGNAERALEEFKAAITSAPGSAIPKLARGQLLASQGQHQQAIRDYSSALASEEGNVSALILRGESRLATFDYELAIQDFSRAIELDPWRLEALVDLARVYEARRENGSANAAFRRATDADPYYQDAWARRGMMHRANGDHRPAIEYLTRALEINPRDWRCWSTRAQSHAVLQEWTEAVNDANMALQLDPDDVDSLLVRAETLIRIGENDSTRQKAMVDLRKAVKLAPDDFGGWFMLAETAGKLKLFEEAAAAAARARCLAPFGAIQAKVSSDDMLALELDMRAEIALVSNPTDFAGQLARARGLANMAGIDRLAQTRAALTLVRQLAQDEALTTQNAPYLAAVARRLAAALFNSGFFSDALGVCALLDSLKLAKQEDLYFAARVATRLGGQQRDARLLFVGADESDRAQLERETNAKPQSERDKLKEQSFANALLLLGRAAQAGFGDSARVTAESEFVPLRAHAQWAQTLKQINDAAADKALQARVAAREPLNIVYVSWLFPEGQAKSKGLRVRDVLFTIGDKQIKALDQLKRVLGGQSASYALTLRRYRMDDNGGFVQRLEAGKPLFDVDGLPVWEFEEIVLDMQPGQLGIRVEEGVVPRERVIP